MTDSSHDGRRAGADDDRPVAALHAALARIAPQHVVVGVRRIDGRDVHGLHAAEAAAVSGVVPKRRREFATGRVLLRMLIGGDVPILPGPTRAPILPDGVVASLAHDDVFAVAAVTCDASIGALGIDVEPVTVLSADVAAVILRREESAIDAHLAFTLKEAAYKAWSVLGGRILDHHDVTLDVHRERFTARVVADGTTFRGVFAQAAGRWLAIVAAPRRPDHLPSSASPVSTKPAAASPGEASPRSES